MKKQSKTHKVDYKYYNSGSKTSRNRNVQQLEINNKTPQSDVVGPIVKISKEVTNETDIISPNNPIINQNQEIFDTYQKSYIEAKKFLNDHNIKISTITLDCKLGTLIDVDLFAKNVILKEDQIVSVKFGNRNDPATNRTIVVLKAKKKPSTKNFYNQVTILMKPTNNPERNYINIKVFKNGSLQMTGCKDMEDFNNVTVKLIEILKNGRRSKKDNKHIKFISDPNKIGIYDVKIRMINSDFKLDYKVDRKKLAKILKKYHGQNTKDKEIGYVECKYQPTGGHSCVNIKYNNDGNKTSIFVFQTGSIIITGAKNLNHIISAYFFIHKVLSRYYKKIKILPLQQNLVQLEIAKYFQKVNQKTYPVEIQE